LAILVTVAAFFLNVYKDGWGLKNAPPDNSFVELLGKVQQKELKAGYFGEDISVIYLIPTVQKNRDFEMVQCYLDPAIKNVPSIGEYVKVSGKVKAFSHPTNPGEFDSYLYYSTLKISYRLNNVKILETGGKISWYREGLYRVKIFFEGVLDSILPEQDAAIMKAMLLGDKAFLDEDTKDMYKSSGIMHTLAVSGLHISIIGMGIYRLLKALMEAAFGYVSSFAPASKRKTPIRIICGVLPTGVSILVMYSYGIMCGMGTSSFRAVFMFVIRLLAPMAGRTYDVLSALSVAEILLLLDQPLYLYNSGFLFSFGAVIGIAVIKPALRPLGDYAHEKIKFVDDRDRQKAFELCRTYAKKTLDGLHTGLSIALATLPVYAMYYYTYPVHSIVLNLFVIPLMTILMLAGIAAMLLGAVIPFLGYFPGFLVHVVLYFYRLISSMDKVNGKFTWYMGHSENYQVALYLVIVVGFIAASNLSFQNEVRKKSKRILKMSLKTIDALRALILIAAVIVLTFRLHTDLEINMIDVGQGDGIVVSSGKMNMLIDGGSTSKKNVGRYQIIPFLKYKGIGKLDLVVLTHEDQDHCSGILEIMDDMEKGGIRIGALMLPEISKGSKGENYLLLEQRAKELSIETSYISFGKQFSMGNCQFLCLNPESGMATDGANEYSTVLYMEYKEADGFADNTFKALFTGDVEGRGQEHINAFLRNAEGRFGDITLLKVAHHGSMYTTDDEFLRLIKPKVALISCGKDNSYGHPHTPLLNRLNKYGADIYRTDMGGEIRVVVDDGKVFLTQYLEK